MAPKVRSAADVIGAAVKVMRIATGNEAEELSTEQPVNLAAEMGRKGGTARAQNLTPEQRVEIAREGAARGWGIRPCKG